MEVDNYLSIKKFRVHIDLTRLDKGLHTKEQIDKQYIESILQPDKDNPLQYTGKEAKTYFEVENTGNKSLGRIVGWITDVFAKLEARKTTNENIEFSLEDLTDWLLTDCVTVFAVTEKHGDFGVG